MYAIVDIETTGLGALGNKITEISIFVHDGQKVIREFTTLVNPEAPIPYRISGLTGITNDMVRKAPKFYEIAKEVIEYTKDCIFVAHSVNFDYNVIRQELTELGAEFKRKKLCTVRLSRKIFPGQRSYSLGNICSTLGIDINGRHRARGDAEATVTLFEKLLEADNDGHIHKFLNPRSRQATLPPLLSRSTIENLPNAPGVYYFKDENGKIIYVGKAIDIKQRVLSHLYSRVNKELKLCNETANITFELTGNELTALLLESDEIKRYFPKYNASQKRVNPSYGIGTYKDRKGIIHIVFDQLKLIPNPIIKFYTQSQCRKFLEELCDRFELCPRYCSLQHISGGCFHYSIKKCHGICRNLEDVEAYNERVENALASYQSKESYIIKETGRTENEHAIILISEGVYKGFGYIETDKTIKTFSEYEQHITLRKDTIDTKRILNSHLSNNPNSILINDDSYCNDHLVR